MEYVDNASSEESPEKYKNSNSLSLSLASTDSDSSSSLSNHKQSFDQDEEDVENLSTNSSCITEVFSDNFEEAFKEIISIKNESNYIGMDTEFPGVIYNPKEITKEEDHPKKIQKESTKYKQNQWMQQ